MATSRKYSSGSDEEGEQQPLYTEKPKGEIRSGYAAFVPATPKTFADDRPVVDEFEQEVESTFEKLKVITSAQLQPVAPPMGHWQQQHTTPYAVNVMASKGYEGGRLGIRGETVNPLPNVRKMTPNVVALLRLPTESYGVYGLEEAKEKMDVSAAKMADLDLRRVEVGLRTELCRTRPIECKNCGSKCHSTQSCLLPPLCYRCRRAGHEIKDNVCSMADYYCFRCRRNIGHSAEIGHNGWWSRLTEAEKSKERAEIKQRPTLWDLHSPGRRRTSRNETFPCSKGENHDH